MTMIITQLSPPPELKLGPPRRPFFSSTGNRFDKGGAWGSGGREVRIIRAQKIVDVEALEHGDAEVMANLDSHFVV